MAGQDPTAPIEEFLRARAASGRFNVIATVGDRELCDADLHDLLNAHAAATKRVAVLEASLEELLSAEPAPDDGSGP